MNPLLPTLADYLASNKDWIIERWLRAVDRQADIPSSENVTREQLIDHLPALCDDLAARLRIGKQPDSESQTEHAEIHGQHRWRQGYKLEELIREAGLINRVVSVECLDAFQAREPNFDASARRAAQAVIDEFFTDVLVDSARQFAEEKTALIHRIEQNSEAILQSAMDAIVVMGADGCVREWNPAAEALFGYRREEAVGHELATLIIPADLRERHRAGLAHYLRTGDGPLLGRRIEVHAVRSDGSTLPVELTITPYRIGEQLLFTGSVRDITERKAAEEANRRLTSLVDSSTDSIISQDLDGRITSWNTGAQQLYGYTAEEAIGQSVAILIAPGREEEERVSLERIRRGEHLKPYDTLRRRRDGTPIDVSLTLSPIVAKDGRIIGVSRIARDITERKRTVEELRRQKEAAETANQTKDRFLAALSHELRTPLNPVLMWACATVEDETLDPTLRDGLKMICRNVEMEARLIDDLLDLTRVARGKLQLHAEPCAADTLIEHAIGIVRSQTTKKNLRVSVDLAASNHQIMADPTRIEQVFWNLLANACKFTPENGEIAVRTYDAGPDVLAIEISDTGSGIAPEVMPNLFMPFEQGRMSVEGLGLGLAICRAVMQLHGGEIHGRNKAHGTGAVFTVEINTIETPDAVAQPREPSPGVQWRKLRILIVEDHEPTAAVMSRLLERDGHEVLVATTVQQALDMLHTTSIELLVSDLGLPDGNGFQVMKELARISNAKGIAVSGYGMEDDIERSSRAGFSAHLTKPINVVALKKTIEKVTAAA